MALVCSGVGVVIFYYKILQSKNCGNFDRTYTKFTWSNYKYDLTFLEKKRAWCIALSKFIGLNIWNSKKKKPHTHSTRSMDEEPQNLDCPYSPPSSEEPPVVNESEECSEKEDDVPVSFPASPKSHSSSLDDSKKTQEKKSNREKELKILLKNLSQHEDVEELLPEIQKLIGHQAWETKMKKITKKIHDDLAELYQTAEKQLPPKKLSVFETFIRNTDVSLKDIVRKSFDPENPRQGASRPRNHPSVSKKRKRAAPKKKQEPSSPQSDDEFNEQEEDPSEVKIQEKTQKPRESTQFHPSSAVPITNIRKRAKHQ